jgi:hypothetical protein
MRQAQAAHARAARAAKRAAAQEAAPQRNGRLALDLERADARWLYDLLEEQSDVRAVSIRRQLVTQAFG